MERIPVKEQFPEDVDSRVFNLYEKKEKIYIRAQEGLFQTIRLFTGWPLLLGYFLAPWLQIEGRQAIFFDLPERQFHILWLTLWPQDFVLLMWTLAIAAFALFFVTTLWGRVWCGYTCPQTVWTAVFSWAEQITEGERHQRINLDQTPSFLSRNGRNRAGWNKLWRRSLKHLMWIGFAALTGITFVGYFYGIRHLVSDALAWQLPLTATAWSVFFTLATYINAGWMREQVCIYMCPYARFQSAMFDKNTLIISYDPSRGEQRGARKRGSDYQAQGLGDCIDCTLCVQVCPTGIDIRNGLQYECIGCALCIDACNSVMDKMEYPRGLIRYTSEHQLEGGTTHWLRPRIIGYAAVLCIMVGVFSYNIFNRIPVELTAIRDRNQLYVETDSGAIENIYTLQLVNMDEAPHEYVLSISGIPDAEIIGATHHMLEASEVRTITLRIRVEPETLDKPSTELNFRVEAVDMPSLQATSESRFMKPL